MSQAVQTLLGNRVKAMTAELIKQIDDLGPERRAVQPQGRCRSALDQAAECSLITMYCAETLKLGGYEGEFDIKTFQQTKDNLAKDWESLKADMTKKAADFATAALAIPDEKLQIKMKLPWGELSSEDVMVYPYWNISYHMGQVAYIGFLTE